MHTHQYNLHENENKLKTISLETSSGKVDQILGNKTNSELWIFGELDLNGKPNIIFSVFLVILINVLK